MPILSILVALPLVAGIIALFQSANGARWNALITTLVSLALGVWLWTAYRPRAARSGSSSNIIELGGGIAWAMGIDGIALMLIMLTLFLMPICIGASWRAIEKRVPEYMASFLLMQSLMIGVFTAQDLLLFYIFFEGGLIPMYLIIGIWGGGRADQGQLQILPLHAGRIGADADRHAGDDLDGRHHLDPRADGL